MAFTQNTDKRVAVFFAAGFEEVEAIAVVDLLFRAGIPCDMVSVTADLQVTSSREVTVVCDRSIEEDDFDFDAYDMLVLPGGIPGMPNLKACEPLCDALKKHAAEGRGVAAICASPSILAELGILAGKHATANPHFQQSVVDNGGILEADARAVTDGSVITSQGMATATWFGLEIVKRYVSDEVVERVKEGIVLMD